MMQNSRYRVLLVLVAILLLTNGLLLYRFMDRKEPEKKNYTRQDRSAVMRQMLKDSVGFDDAQLKRFDELRAVHTENVKRLFEEMRNAKMAFYTQVNQPALSDSAKQAAASVIGDRQKALDLAFYNHFLDLRTICREDQVTKFDTLVQNIVRRMVSPRRGEPKEKKQSK